MAIDLKKLQALTQEKTPKGPEGGKALLVFMHERELLPDGGGLCLCWDADEAISSYIHDCGGSRESFPLKDVPIDYDAYKTREPGAYIARLRLIDDGPGDWPGAQETLLQLHDIRLATAAEWKAHLDGEWPWEEKYSE